MIEFIDIPEDILIYILKFLEDQNTRLNLLTTCKTINTILTPRIWHDITLVDLSVSEYLNGMVTSEQAVQYEQETKLLAKRHFGVFDSSLESSIDQGNILPGFPGQENSPISTYISATFLKNILKNQIRPYVLMSIRTFDLNVNCKYPTQNQDLINSSSNDLSNQKLITTNNIHNLSPQFELACKYILSPHVLPNLRVLTLRYSVCCTSSNSEMLIAMELLDQVCKNYKEKINIDLLGWSLKLFLSHLDVFLSLGNCLRTLHCPKVERDLESVDLLGRLTKLSHLSLGHYSSLLKLENVVAQPINTVELSHFISQLNGLKALQILGSSDCLNTELIPASVTTLDFPEEGLFKNIISSTITNAYLEPTYDPPFEISNYHQLAYPISPLANLTSLCIRLSTKSQVHLPYYPSLIPVENLKSLTILVSDPSTSIDFNELLNFYSAIFYKNKYLETLSLDAIYCQSLKVIADNCKNLENLSILRPMLDQPADKINESFLELGRIETLRSLVIPIFGPQLEFKVISEISKNCKNLIRFHILQESAVESASTIDILSSVSTWNSNTPENLSTPSFSVGTPVNEYMGPETPDLSSNPQTLLNDLYLIEEGLKAINNFNFEDIEINDHVDYDDLNLNLGDHGNSMIRDLESSSYSYFEPEFPSVLHKPHESISFENKSQSLNPPTILLLKDCSKAEMKSFILLDQFSDRPSLKGLSAMKTLYTLFSCNTSYIRQNF